MKRKAAIYILPIASAVCAFLITCIFSAPFLGFAMLIPFLISLSKCQSFKEFLKASAIFFVIYYSLGYSFLLKLYELLGINRTVGIILSILSAVLLGALCAVLHMLPTLLYFRFSKKRVTDSFFYACLFTLGEFIISALPIIGYPMITLSLCMTDFKPFLQISSLFGSLFITFLIVLINALFTSALTARIISIKALAATASAVVIFAAVTVFGVIRINTFSADGENITAAAVQTDKRGLTKISDSTASPLSDCMDDILSVKDADMIFLPETAITTDLDDFDARYDIRTVLSKTNAELLTGIFEDTDDGSYNAFCAFSQRGTAVYRKSSLVLFGEYSLFSDKLFDGTDSLISADEIKPLKAQNADVAVGICIESIYPSVIRRQVKAGGEIIAVPTNDSWFFGTHLQKLHLRHSVLRSVENARYCVRAANSGISAVISPMGEIIKSIPEGVTGAISAQITKLSKRTFYTLTGNLWLIVPLGGFLFVAFFNLKQTRRIRLFKLDL